MSYFEYELSWIIGLVTTMTMYLLFWYRRPYNYPPGPRGLPILGYLPFFSKRIECDVHKLSKKYGSVMCIRMGSSDAVFLNDYKAVYDSFVKHGSVCSGRGRFATYESVKNGLGIAFVDYGDLWKEQRKFASATLKGFGVGKRSMENICQEELYYLNEEIQSKNGKPFDISIIFHNAIANVLCHNVVGKRFNYHEKQFKRMLEIVIDGFDDPWISVTDKLLTLYPNLKYFPPFSYFNRKFVAMLNELYDWFTTIVEEHEKTFDENNIRDFIDAFLSEKRKRKNSSFTNLQLVNFLHELFVAGTDTSATTLCWGLLCLLHYPETQKKLRKEILDVYGTSGTISLSKKSETPYTNAFIQELMRFRTLVPLGVPHKANEKIVLNGYDIPKETVLFSNIWAVHNDPNLWKNPEIFNPERFIDGEGNFIKSNHVIPFSIGPRMCLGDQLARMEIFVFLVGLVQKFEFLPDPTSKQLPSIDDGSLGVVYLPISYKIVAKEY